MDSDIFVRMQMRQQEALEIAGRRRQEPLTPYRSGPIHSMGWVDDSDDPSCITLKVRTEDRCWSELSRSFRAHARQMSRLSPTDCTEHLCEVRLNYSRWLTLPSLLLLSIISIKGD